MSECGQVGANHSPRYAHLRRIREAELKRAAEFFPASGRVLEIGAGAGWQSLRLTEAGYEVAAVDLADSRYRAAMVYPVVVYDGCRLPFADGAFDVVFSSNVLEHVKETELLEAEMLRVLAANGAVVHVVPSATWRWLTILTHYPALFRDALRLVLTGNVPSAGGQAGGRAGPVDFLRALFPHRHGVSGSAVGELVSFSRVGWRRYFERHGWAVSRCVGVGLVYSGNQLFDGALSWKARSCIAYFLGSSATIWVLRKARGA